MSTGWRENFSKRISKPNDLSHRQWVARIIEICAQLPHTSLDTGVAIFRGNCWIQLENYVYPHNWVQVNALHPQRRESGWKGKRLLPQNTSFFVLTFPEPENRRKREKSVFSGFLLTDPLHPFESAWEEELTQFRKITQPPFKYIKLKVISRIVWIGGMLAVTYFSEIWFSFSREETPTFTL